MNLYQVGMNLYQLRTNMLQLGMNLFQDRIIHTENLSLDFSREHLPDSATFPRYISFHYFTLHLCLPGASLLIHQSNNDQSSITQLLNILKVEKYSSEIITVRILNFKENLIKMFLYSLLPFNINCSILLSIFQERYNEERISIKS